MTRPAQTTTSLSRALHTLAGWRLWSMPRRLVAYLLVVETIAVTLTVIGFDRAAVDGQDVRTFGLIVGLGVATAELTRHVERLRRRFADTPHVNMSSVWTLSAALLLPAALAAATAVLLYLHLWLRSWYRVRGVHLYRLTFSACTVILASYGAGTALHTVLPTGLTDLENARSMAALAVAVTVYSIINSGLVAAAIGLLEGRIVVGRMLGSARENAVEYATLGLGLSTTAFLLTQPLLILAQIPALMLLHRCVLVRQLEEAAATDHRTGLLNATTWTSLATTELARATRDHTTLGILMIDLDHFTRINTTHGHPAGDTVLHHVADTLRHSVRPDDIVARLSGEEFIVLCPDLTSPDLLTIAERIRTKIKKTSIPLAALDGPTVDVTITVSVGAALYPDSGPTLDDLLRAADVALFAAKDTGRDRVQTITNNHTHQA